MTDMTKPVTLIMLADEAASRLRDLRKQASASPPPTEKAAAVSAALVKAAHIREDQATVVTEALQDHAIALEMLEKLASRTVPVSQTMGQEVTAPEAAQSPLRRRSHDDTEAGRKFRAAFQQ